MNARVRKDKIKRELQVSAQISAVNLTCAKLLNLKTIDDLTGSYFINIEDCHNEWYMISTVAT